MEWIEALKQAIDYIEEHLMEDISVEKAAEHVYLSPFYFQKGFKLITGYTVGEYVRNRRLYLAALEIVKGERRVIDLAYQFGYDTPESFSKAFTRFHGVSPVQVKEKPYKMNVFHPLQVSLSIKGADKLDYCIEEMEAFDVIGLGKSISYNTAFDEIPPYWEVFKKQLAHEKNEAIKNIVTANNIGMYGICAELGENSESFEYLIAGPLCKPQKTYPGIFKVLTIPALTWVKFRCIGPMPQALQSLNKRVFNEWLLNNTQYEMAAGYNIEVYSKKDIKAEDYVSEMWIPISKY